MIQKKTLNLLTDQEFEDICIRCGARCGAYDGDPCEHLRQDRNGQYYCEIYHTRKGTHYTVMGLEMDCVSIITKLKTSWIGDKYCSYKNMLKKGEL